MSSIILTVVLNGATLMSEESAKENNSYDHFSMFVTETKRIKGKKTEVKTRLEIATRQSVPATQVLPISEETIAEWTNPKNVPSYFYYIDKGGFPRLKKDMPNWRHMSNEERINFHCSLIASDLKGTDYSWEYVGK